MSTTVFRSELFYHTSLERQEKESPVRKPLRFSVDSLTECPGSRKGDCGHWVLTEWIDWQLQRLLGKSGTERR